MAILAPVRGLVYNPEVVPNLADVVTPPYDVISPTQQEDFYARHPYNMVRLILPRKEPRGDDIPDRYARAAADFARWRRESVLVRDPAPALHYWETDFSLAGQTVTRRGLVGLLRLEPFESGSVRPHEKTFSAHKNDRFQLITHCLAQFSTIFALYPDQPDQVLSLLRQGIAAPPEIDFADYDGQRHRSFRVTDPGVLRAVSQAMQSLPIFIADGHHRYETSLAVQGWLQQQYPQASPRATFNYVLMYLSNMSDPGLVVLPAHRLLNTSSLTGFSEAALYNRLPEFFDLERIDCAGDCAGSIAAALSRGGEQGTALVVANSRREATLLRLKPGVMTSSLAAHLPAALAGLDVIVLNFLIFEKIIQLTQPQQDDPAVFHYDSTIPGALQALEEGKVQLAFLLNPTKIEQVQAVANAGLIMPRKSTYFYPKVIAGLVMSPIDPGEEVPF